MGIVSVFTHPENPPRFQAAVHTRWGPLTTISGFIPSYTHLQPWLNRVCWGYNYLITRVAPCCRFPIVFVSGGSSMVWSSSTYGCPFWGSGGLRVPVFFVVGFFSLGFVLGGVVFLRETKHERFVFWHQNMWQFSLIIHTCFFLFLSWVSKCFSMDLWDWYIYNIWCNISLLFLFNGNYMNCRYTLYFLFLNIYVGCICFFQMFCLFMVLSPSWGVVRILFFLIQLPPRET